MGLWKEMFPGPTHPIRSFNWHSWALSSKAMSPGFWAFCHQSFRFHMTLIRHGLVMPATTRSSTSISDVCQMTIASSSLLRNSSHWCQPTLFLWRGEQFTFSFYWSNLSMALVNYSFLCICLYISATYFVCRSFICAKFSQFSVVKRNNYWLLIKFS